MTPTVSLRHAYDHGDKSFFFVTVNLPPGKMLKELQYAVISAMRDVLAPLRTAVERKQDLRAVVSGVGEEHHDLVVNYLTIALEKRGCSVLLAER